MATIKLSEIAHARSGDKGNHANVGVISLSDAAFEHLKLHLSADTVASYFEPLGPTKVERFELPGIRALNFLLHDVLAGGASRSLRVDSPGQDTGTCNPGNGHPSAGTLIKGHTMFVELKQENGVARVCLNRPDKRNALTDEFIREITAAVQQVADDRDARVMVLAASGTVFCAGMDLAQMQQRATAENREELWMQDSQILRDTFKAIFELQIPTLAVAQGPAVAGGMGLIAACDMVLASKTAFFALPEPQRGITAAMVTPLLLHRIAVSPANELLLGGGRMSAQRAVEVGLCVDAVEPEDLEQAEKTLVRSILNGSRSALAFTKQHVINSVGGSVMQQLDESVGLSAEARQTEDAREGLQAFLDKRKANWIPE